MLTIGYIHPGLVREEFAHSLLMAAVGDTQDRRVITGVLGVPTSILAHGRNTLCQQFLSTDDQWLLMVDTDIIFTLADVYALLDADLPVLGGLYLMRHGNPQPCWTVGDFTQALDIRPEPMVVNSVGTGFLLLHREVLEKLQANNPDEPWPWFGHDIVKGVRAGEDISFCHRLNQIGVQVHGHGGVHVGHVGTTVLYPIDHVVKENVNV